MSSKAVHIDRELTLKRLEEELRSIAAEYCVEYRYDLKLDESVCVKYEVFRLSDETIRRALEVAKQGLDEFEDYVKHWISWYERFGKPVVRVEVDLDMYYFVFPVFRSVQIRLAAALLYVGQDREPETYELWLHIDEKEKKIYCRCGFAGAPILEPAWKAYPPGYRPYCLGDP